MDRLIDVLAVDPGNEALVERVCDERTMSSRSRCDPSLDLLVLISVFQRHMNYRFKA
jgi:hypothetical protein